jgi:hypothetical protein
VSTTKHTLSPAADVALGALALVVAIVLRSRARRSIERREPDEKAEKKDPRWIRAISRGSPRIAFALGAVLTLPGASYLAALYHLGKLNYSPGIDVVVVIGFNLVMLALLEVPLVCFLVAPEWTPGAIDRAKAWLRARGPRLAVRALAVIGVLLIIKGGVELLTA